MFKKLNPKTKPKLSIHKYVLVITHATDEKQDQYFYYAKTMSEIVRQYILKSEVGDTIEIFKAEHSFHSAYERLS